MDLAGKTATALARRSSRRQFFKFLGAGSLGAGLFLARTDVTLGSITQCVGCGGGPCNPCGSPFQQCSVMPCKPCSVGGGCPDGCTTSGEWFCCLTAPPPPPTGREGCRFRCSECSCPSPQGCCRCFTNQPMPCNPRPHSGDQPCLCPPLETTVPNLVLQDG